MQNVAGNADITLGDRVAGPKIEGDVTHIERKSGMSHAPAGDETPPEFTLACPACGAGVRPGERNCKRCGRPLQ